LRKHSKKRKGIDSITKGGGIKIVPVVKNGNGLRFASAPRGSVLIISCVLSSQKGEDRFLLRKKKWGGGVTKSAKIRPPVVLKRGLRYLTLRRIDERKGILNACEEKGGKKGK